MSNSILELSSTVRINCRDFPRRKRLKIIETKYRRISDDNCYKFKNFSGVIPSFDIWWLVRVALVVDWLLLPQNSGLVVGTYEDLLLFCECTWGGGSICRWLEHLTTIGGNLSFLSSQVVGTLKPSITYPSLPSLPPHSLLTPLPHAPNRGIGDPKT